MQMTLTITAESPAEMVTVLQALQVSGVETPVQVLGLEKKAEEVAAVPAEVEQPPAPARRGRPPGVKNSPSMVKALEKAQSAPELTVVPKEDAPKKDITIMDVRKALTEYLAANNEAKAGELLAKHGKTDRLSKLSPEYFEAVYHAAVTPVVHDFDDDLTGTNAR